MSRRRVVIAGFGETGVLTAVRLSKRYDVVGISTKPSLVSGQELGLRLTRPDWWARDYHHSFDALRGLDRARVVHGTITGADLDARTVRVTTADGAELVEPYDVLVISTGVSNGFWRRPGLETPEDVAAGIEDAHQRLAAAPSIAIVGGGAAAVGTAWNAARVWPGKQVDLYFPGEVALPEHHRRVWTKVRGQLEAAGVGIHPGHRAVVPGEIDRITDEPVAWTTGQDDVHADAVLWAIGRTSPNTAWVPAELLDDDGYVRAGLDLKVPGVDGVFAIGDVAATDPLRSSARNFTFKLLASNVRAHLEGRALKTFTPPARRWGSVNGYQEDGLVVYTPKGQSFRIPRLPVDRMVRSRVVDRGYYRGIRR